jgi:hypothetical protein
MKGLNLRLNKTGRSLTSVLRSGIFDDVRKFMFIVSLHHIHVFVLLFSGRNGIRLHLERDS